MPNVITWKTIRGPYYVDKSEKKGGEAKATETPPPPKETPLRDNIMPDESMGTREEKDDGEETVLLELLLELEGL